MANQGFPFEGSDTRLLGGIFARICSALSFRSNVQPPHLILSLGAVKLYLPTWWLKNPDGTHKFLQIRAGWRYDYTAKAYILSCATKIEDYAKLY